MVDKKPLTEGQEAAYEAVSARRGEWVTAEELEVSNADLDVLASQNIIRRDGNSREVPIYKTVR